MTNIDSKIGGKVDTALIAIDSVHGDGILKDIPINMVKGKSSQAAFYSTQTGVPHSIAVSDHAVNPELSFIHEMGHYFDLHAIGRPGQFDSISPNSLMSDFLITARGSDNIQELQRIYNTGKMTINGSEYLVAKNFKSHLEYLLEPEEIWARAYAQFIAERSGDAKLHTAIQERHDFKKGNGYTTQWESKDFGKISKQIEAWMLKLNWMTNRS